MLVAPIIDYMYIGNILEVYLENIQKKTIPENKSFSAKSFSNVS